MDKVIIEQHENFIKQSYRNRTHILTANGIDALSIPLLVIDKKAVHQRKITNNDARK